MVNEDWFTTSAETAYRLPCFDWLLVESPVVVRNGRETPLFDQRFVDGWFERVQYVEHLRLKGFRFWVLSDVYGWVDGGDGVRTDSLRPELRPRGESADSRAADVAATRMKRLFLHWFDDVKQNREVNRTRVCSEKERNRHRIDILFRVCSKCFMWTNPSSHFRVGMEVTAEP